ncbi:MAG: MBL fold metallo-hydrolase [Ignisphaera sp.]
MNVKILGTRGEIEEKCREVNNHSGILIDDVLFDVGEKEYLEYKPKAIFVTHLHPDHWNVEGEIEIPVYSIEKPKEAKNWTKLKKGQTVKINNFKITPIPTTHSKKVKSCAFLIENNKRILYTGDMIWINKKYHDLIKNLDLVITEASNFDRDLIRRDKKTGEIYGHSSAKKLYDLFSKLGAKKILFVHYGKWFVDNPKEGQKKLESLGNNIIIGRDNYTMALELKPEDVEAITPKVTATPQVGLILVEPHGKWIYEGKKTGIVKSIRLEEHIEEPLYLIADKLCYGIITLHPPVEIDRKEFKKLYERHRITEEEREKWCAKEKSWCKFPLYFYDFSFEKFPKPIPIRLKVKGPQVFVKAENIEFLQTKDLNLEELIYLHGLCHSYHEEIGDIWCQLHFGLAIELINRGLYHEDKSGCDRVVFVDQLIKETGPDWIKQYERNLPKYNDRQVGDDWRIVLGWYSSIKEGRKLYKHYDDKKVEITEDDCKKLALILVKEMIKRGFTFNRPETYKKHARELFEYVIKQIGEDKIPWKDELTEALLQPTDITVSYVQKLSDKELEELWKKLHERWKKEFPDGKVNEDYLNANIIIQIERFKRGLIDVDYEDQDKLDEASRFAWQEYGGVTPLTGPEEEGEIRLEDVVETFREVGVIPVKGQPYASYLIGRIVNEKKVPKDHDIDLLFRQKPDPRLVIAIKKSLPDWLSKRIHVVFDEAGPGIGLSLPIHGYALNPLPEELQKIGFGPFRLESLKTGKYIVGVKPKSGWFKYEFWDPKEAWVKWGADHVPMIVEEKVDGRRHQIHIMPDNSVKMITEDTHRDRANIFPEIVKELQSLNIPDSILDGEILMYQIPSNMQAKNARTKREMFELVPREDTAAITAAKSLTPEYRSKLVLVIYDIMKLKGKDLVDLPYEQRRKIYLDLIPNNLKFIDTVRGEKASNMKEFFRLVQKYRSVNGSEGVVCKDVNFKYPIKYSGENRSEDMMKIKNLKEIDVIVLGIKQKKEKKTGRPLPTYMYECYILLPKEKASEWYPEDLKEYNGKIYAKIGYSYGTSVKAKIGDIITVMPIRIRFYEKNGKKRVTWMFPLFKEIKKEKKEADPLSVAEKLARLGTRPPISKSQLESMSLEEIDNYEEPVITIELKTCPFYPDWNICPLRKRYGIRRVIMNLAIIEEEVLKYPVMCPLASRFKCPYLKDYYYDYVTIKYHPELSLEEDIGEIINYSSLPRWLEHKLQGKYMEMPKGEFDFVMESHILTKEFVSGEKKIPKTGSQHIDFRIAINGALVGWSIVGGNVEKMITPKLLLEKKGKGFRAEPKAMQPKVWLFKDKPLDEIFDVVVGQGEPRGKMFIMTRGKAIHGAQKLDIHEYFVKSTEIGKYGGFPDWTRIIVVPVRVPKVDPETKQPIKGKYETMYRLMIPKDQTPYAISDRAMKKGWVPPKSNPEPFPVDWVKKNFPEQYKKWKEWLESKMKSKELSNIKYTLSMHQYRGPIHVRGMYIRSYYLFLDDKGKGSVRTFKLDDNPMFSTQIAAWDEGRDDRKYLTWEGTTSPMSRFNPNKAITGEMKILESGTVDYTSEKSEDGREIITLNFKGKILKGTWILEQHGKGEDRYFFYSQETSLERTYDFVLHKHMVGSKNNYHYDIRILRDNKLDEFNLYGDIIELKPGQGVEAYRKTCYEPEKWFIKEGTDIERNIGPLKTWITVVDHGKATILEENPQFISMILNSNKFKNAYFIAKKEDGKWTFERDIIRGLSAGDPVSGEYYSPFVIKEKSTWDYFNVYIYDPREFTRTVEQDMVKEYLPDLTIPEGVTIYIGLYPVPGEIHNARVMMVQFKKDKWDYKSAESWIKKNKLHTWKSKMIRKVGD